ncbi:MAG: preprotein translocase subunit SecE [Syntrophobacteraceae bacterium]|nr:preprotein translocase subunit SecE [Syntrophobacteraceae bacterium]
MKLIAKDEQTSEGRARTATKAKKASPKAEAPLKPKKFDPSKKGDASKKVVKKSGEAGKPMVDVARNYLREVVVELKKVVWPSRKETLGSTAVILAIVGLTGIFLGLVDLLLSRLLHFMVH